MLWGCSFNFKTDGRHSAVASPCSSPFHLGLFFQQTSLKKKKKNHWPFGVLLPAPPRSTTAYESRSGRHQNKIQQPCLVPCYHMYIPATIRAAPNDSRAWTVGGGIAASRGHFRTRATRCLSSKVHLLGTTRGRHRIVHLTSRKSRICMCSLYAKLCGGCEK